MSVPTPTMLSLSHKLEILLGWAIAGPTKYLFEFLYDRVSLFFTLAVIFLISNPNSTCLCLLPHYLTDSGQTYCHWRLRCGVFDYIMSDPLVLQCIKKQSDNCTWMSAFPLISSGKNKADILVAPSPNSTRVTPLAWLRFGSLLMASIAVTSSAYSSLSSLSKSTNINHHKIGKRLYHTQISPSR